MKQLEYAPLALKDLQSIANYIASNNPTRADSFVAELRAKARQAAERPRSFRSRNDVRPGLRSALHGEYVLLFRELNDVVRIERVMHGKQNLSTVRLA